MSCGWSFQHHSYSQMRIVLGVGFITTDEVHAKDDTRLGIGTRPSVCHSVVTTTYAEAPWELIICSIRWLG